MLNNKESFDINCQEQNQQKILKIDKNFVYYTDECIYYSKFETLKYFFVNKWFEFIIYITNNKPVLLL